MKSSFQNFPASSETFDDLRWLKNNSRHFLIRTLNRRMLQDVDETLPPTFTDWVNKSSLKNRFMDRRSRFLVNRRQIKLNHDSKPCLRSPTSTHSDLFFASADQLHSGPPGRFANAHQKPPSNVHYFRNDLHQLRSLNASLSIKSSAPQSNDVTDETRLPPSSQSQRAESDESRVAGFQHPVPIPVSHAPATDEPSDFVSPHLLLIRNEKKRRQVARVKVAQGKKPVPVRTEVCVTSFPTLVEASEPITIEHSPTENDSDNRMTVTIMKRVVNPPLEAVRSSRIRFGVMQNVAVEAGERLQTEVKDQENVIIAEKSELFQSGKRNENVLSVGGKRSTQFDAKTQAVRDDVTTYDDAKMVDAEVMLGSKAEFSLELGPIEMNIECYPACSDHPAGFGTSGFDIPSSKPMFGLSGPANGSFESFYPLQLCNDNLDDTTTKFDRVNSDNDVTSTDGVISKRVLSSDDIQPISELVTSRVEPDNERVDGSIPASKCTCEPSSIKVASSLGSEPLPLAVS